MARGFGNPLKAFRRADRDIASLALLSAISAAEKTVKQLQEEGPSWTGRFSNSWQIEGPQGQTVKGDGRTGEPRPIKFKEAPFTGPQATATLLKINLLKDKTVFKISNFSEHAAIAIDALQQSNSLYQNGWEKYGGPITDLGISNLDISSEGREGGSSLRGDIGGGSNTSASSRTAPLDWFATFVEGGRLDKTVKISVDEILRKGVR